MKFTSTYQPNHKTRKRRGRGKKQILEEEYKHLFSNELNVMSVKTELIKILFAKENHTLKELELINKIISDLLPYQLSEQSKQINITTNNNIEEMSTLDFLESITNEK